MPMAPDAPEPESHRRRAVEDMRCPRGHRWVRLRDPTGFVNRECPQCGKPPIAARVVTMTLIENPSDETESSGGFGEMWD